MAREKDLEVQNSLDVYNLAKAGDERALDVFKTMGRYLGITLGGLVNALNPEMIVLGGGVATGMDAFSGHLRAELNKRAFHEPADRVQIVKGELKDNAGILGVAHSAFPA